MSDKIYLPSEIPEGYDYATFGDGFITLYNQDSAQEETIPYYRIHYGYSSGLVTSGYATFGNYEQHFEQVETSREFFDRPDSFNIVMIIFVLCIFGLWLLNLMTSIVRRNGIFSGLL